ncbi:MAG: o-succinylbenzoate--CoA ligase [Bacillus sp. (in: firmicutes)]
MEQTRIPNWLQKRADLSPTKLAIAFEEQSFTFQELYDASLSFSKKLHYAGIRKHQVVGVLQSNSPEMALTIHALLHLGAEMVLFNTRLTKEELSWQFRHAQIQWIITENAFQPICDETLEKASCIYVEELPHMKESDDFEPRKEFDLQQTATIMYTSGTTGFPKGVMQTYGNHWWSSVGSMLNLGLHENDKWLCTLPFFHISGLSILLRSVIYGMSVVVHKQFQADKANRAIEEQDVTIMSVVTATLNRMLHELGERKYPSSFRCMLLGGGPAPLTILETCKEKGIPVFQTYGMTETASQIVTLSPQDSVRKLGSAGKALFPSQIKIVCDGETAEAGTVGEIFVKGPNVTVGYIHQAEATEKAFEHGWLKTGDMGYCDHEGFLYVVDRRSDLIISGGENIYPAEIEAVLMKHPAVYEAGVAGIEDEMWGQVAAAFIVPYTDDIDLEDIREHCQTYLASYKVPKRFYVVRELPRNSANKLVRRNLVKLLEDEEG